jgi:hypothetical protein
MAYMDFAAHRGDAMLLEPLFPPARVKAGQASDLDHREWAIVRLARTDGLPSIREEGRFGRLFRLIFGIERKNPLSDERLEALRRLAVLSWHHGYNVAPSEVSGFLNAGYSERQYEVLLARIVTDRAESHRRTKYEYASAFPTG